MHDVLGSLQVQQLIGFLSHWNPYKMLSLEAVAFVHIDGGVVLVGLTPISVANWLPSVLYRCWLGHLTCKYCLGMTYNASSGTHAPTH